MSENLQVHINVKDDRFIVQFKVSMIDYYPYVGTKQEVIDRLNDTIAKAEEHMRDNNKLHLLRTVPSFMVNCPEYIDKYREVVKRIEDGNY